MSISDAEYREYMSDACSSSTGTLGEYACNIVPDGEYRVTPLFSGGFGTCINNLDKQVLNNHLLAVEPLTERWEIVAADLNNDGMISGLDMAILIQIIDNGIPNDPTIPAYSFVPEETYVVWPVVVPYTNTVWPFNEYLDLNFPNSSVPDANFIGIRKGDIDGSCTACSSTGNRMRNPDFEQQAFSQLEKPLVVPNPIGTENPTIVYQVEKSSETSLKIFSATGQLLYFGMQEAIKGENRFDIPDNLNFAPGFYSYFIETDSNAFSGKFIKQ